MPHPPSVSKLRRLHIAFSWNPTVDHEVMRDLSEGGHNSVDHLLEEMITDFQRLELVTVDLPETNEVVWVPLRTSLLPRTFRTGPLRYQQTDDWWSKPDF